MEGQSGCNTGSGQGDFGGEEGEVAPAAQGGVG